MKRRAGTLFLLVPMILLALPTSAVQADTVEPLPLIIQERIVYDEGYDEGLQGDYAPSYYEGGDFGFGVTIRYRVTNPAENAGEGYSFPTIAFAVETSIEDEDLIGGYTTETRSTWNSTILTMSEWNGPTAEAGDGYMFGALPDEDFPEGRHTDDFGKYEDLFGGGGILAAQVAFYFDNEGTQNAIEPGERQGGFAFVHSFAIEASDTLTIVTQGNAPGATAFGVSGVSNLVPIPSAAWMGLGLLGILAAARRRRRNR